MTKDEALHKALKVLNCLNNDRLYETAWVKGAINACEESLATNEESSVVQPAQEPVYFVKHPNGYGWIDVDKDEYNQEKYDEDKWKLYTYPHQWQRLTDDEIDNLLFDDFGIDIDEWFKYARAIEQALKEKQNETA